MTAETKKPKLKVGDVIRVKNVEKYFGSQVGDIPDGAEGIVGRQVDSVTFQVEFYKFPAFEANSKILSILAKETNQDFFVNFERKIASPKPMPVGELFHFEYEILESPPKQVIYIHHSLGKDVSKEIEEIKKLMEKNNVTDFKICDQPRFNDEPLPTEGYMLPGIHIEIPDPRRYVPRVTEYLRGIERNFGFSGPCLDGSDLSALKAKLNDIFSKPGFMEKAKAVVGEEETVEDLVYNSEKPSETLKKVKEISDKGVDLHLIDMNLIDQSFENLEEYSGFADKMAKFGKEKVKEYTTWLGKKRIALGEAKYYGDAMYDVYQMLGDAVETRDIKTVISLLKDIDSNAALNQQEKKKMVSEIKEYYKTYSKEQKKTEEEEKKEE